MSSLPTSALVVGLGITGEAVARALAARGTEVTVVEDHPLPQHRRTAESVGVNLVEAPSEADLRVLLASVEVVLPSPGVPERHPIFGLAGELGVPIASELDIAAAIDRRPLVAITGTDGKTTVTSMVTEMLRASGKRAVAAGNTELPLVSAVCDDTWEIFVVEASSFRLGHTQRFEPIVATWLNVGDDHQDVHDSLDSYVEAKARIWADLGPGAVAVANAEDPVVMARTNPACHTVTFGLAVGDYRVRAGHLSGPEGDLVAVAEMPRRFPHDLANALAAAATARAAGAGLDAIAEVLRRFVPLPHRLEWVAKVAGVDYYDDSKATAPHATLAALAAFESVVLIAGGRNKGLDLSPLASGARRMRAVVAIGEAASEVTEVLSPVVPVEEATSMDDAVAAAARLARPGDSVLLSPACASFDWYSSYSERGDAFVRAVRNLVPGGAAHGGGKA